MTINLLYNKPDIAVDIAVYKTFSPAQQNGRGASYVSAPGWRSRWDRPRAEGGTPPALSVKAWSVKARLVESLKFSLTGYGTFLGNRCVGSTKRC